MAISYDQGVADDSSDPNALLDDAGFPPDDSNRKAGELFEAAVGEREVDHLISPPDESDRPASQPAPATQKDDPNRIAYHQSRADRALYERDLAMKEAALLRQEAEAYKQVQPVVEMLRSNPELVQLIQAKSSPVQPPMKPERPNNYSHDQAVADPNSESAKYEAAQQKYQEDRLAYLENRISASETQLRERIEEEKRVRAQEEFVEKAYGEAQRIRGWSPVKAEEFADWATNPKNVTVEVLTYLYDIIMARKENKPQPHSAQRAPASSPPPPLRGGSLVGDPRYAPATEDEQASFTRMMQGWIRKPQI